MRISLTLSAFVVATTLITVCGCTEPETIAKRSTEETAKPDRPVAPRKLANETADRSHAAEGKTDPSETGKQPATSKSSSGSKSPRAGKLGNRTGLNSEVAGRAAGDRDSSPESDRDSLLGASAAPNEMDAEPESTKAARSEPPKEEFKFEFVSSTGVEGLEPGDTIPEITGKDLDNIKFNLSDYEGKVIMLDFWGDW